MKLNFKGDILPHLIAILTLLIFSIVLFYPSIKGAKILGPDSISSTARYKYINDHKEETGHTARWNPSQFSGDPRVMKVGKEFNLLNYTHSLFTLNMLYPVGMFFALGLVFYLSLCLMGVNRWLSLTLSAAYMLSYIFFTLYEAGHGQKVLTLVYCPLIISGTISLLGKRKLNGMLALLLGTSLSIYVGHVQMVFYLILALSAFGIPLLIFAFLDKEVKPFFKGLGIAILIAFLALGTNYAQVKSTLSFSKQTMRGGSILTQKDDSNSGIEKESGLKWDYAMSWSFEVKEFFSIIVPYIAGGGSQEKVGKENPISKLMLKNNAQVKHGKVSIPGYWGNMPFTSGGAYIGAGVFMLFILSLFLMDRKYSYAFLAAFLMIFFLSLGKNASWLNRLFFDYLPMFSKFRAPSSVISILPAFIFLAAGLGMHKFLETKDKNATLKKLTISSVISIGVLALLFIIGNISFDFLSVKDMSYPANVQDILVEGRKMLFKADIFRSILFIVLVSGILFLYIKNILKSTIVFFIALASILIFDLLPVDTRLITNKDYVSKKKFEREFKARPSDIKISKAEPNGRGFYRVLDQSVNTFNDAKSSYHHNQIGGYSAIKTQRYQDMIENHISKNNMEVLNMLNGKYIISKSGEVQTNLNANGNAWFVKNIKYVTSHLEEIDALNSVNTKETAVVKKDEFDNLIAGDGNGSIKLTSFSPDKMVYNSNSNQDQLAVFSETWYNGKTGWKATIDGNETDISRANYILRAIEIPKGSHEIIMEFNPQAKGSIVSLICSILSWALIISIILISFDFIKAPTFIKNFISPDLV